MATTTTTTVAVVLPIPTATTAGPVLTTSTPATVLHSAIACAVVPVGPARVLRLQHRLHLTQILPEAQELLVEQVQVLGKDVLQTLGTVCDHCHLPLHEGPNLRLTKLFVDFLEAANHGETQPRRDHVPRGGALGLKVGIAALAPLLVVDFLLGQDAISRLSILARPSNLCILSVDDVLDVLRDTCIGTDAVLVHHLHQFTLLQVVWRPRIVLVDRNACHFETGAILDARSALDLVELLVLLLPRHREPKSSLFHGVPLIGEVVVAQRDHQVVFGVAHIVHQRTDEVSGDVVVEFPLLALCNFSTRSAANGRDGRVVPSVVTLNGRPDVRVVVQDVAGSSAPVWMVRLLAQRGSHVEGGGIAAGLRSGIGDVAVRVEVFCGPHTGNRRHAHAGRCSLQKLHCV
mmetsp:Transcript_49580/g.105507  ORF Transcript_49580/g.105507 Transcript_49580/m.105507 type:complete len:403 (+) Transcript_49580:279-1487(+)